jgi:hypothetical protein
LLHLGQICSISNAATDFLTRANVQGILENHLDLNIYNVQ